jgi:septum formation protein
MDIILASQSPYRRQQLENLGLKFKVHAAKIDERSLEKQFSQAEEVCKELSRAKVQVVQKVFPEDLIIGSDQLVDLNGEILGKPGSVEAAADQLFKMSGKTHRLLTGLCMMHRDQVYEHVDITEIKIKELTHQQCLNYAKLDQPIDCAGAYKIEKAGPLVIESIKSQDFTSIQGLPLISVVQALKQFNAHPLDFGELYGNTTAPKKK